MQAGLALFDVMRMVEKPVKTVVLGRAASMGVIIFLAGNKREMLSHSTIMIHDPAFGSRNIGGLMSHELKVELDDLNRCREILADIIAERTGKKLKEIYKVTAVDHYMNSKEALDFGLATGLYEKLFTRRFDLCVRDLWIWKSEIFVLPHLTIWQWTLRGI